MLKNAEEQILVRRLNKGDQTAFELLFYRYRGKIYNFVRVSLPHAVDAEEIVHETFLRIWINRNRIDAALPFGPYVFRTARNLVIDTLRSRAHQLIYLNDVLFSKDVDTDNPAGAVEEDLLQEWFERALDQLPEQRREIFMMSRMEGLSYKEIARRLGITENTVDTQIRRALLFFRTELKKLRLLFLF